MFLAPHLLFAICEHLGSSLGNTRGEDPGQQET